jgi:hypothetical protein
LIRAFFAKRVSIEYRTPGEVFMLDPELYVDSTMLCSLWIWYFLQSDAIIRSTSASMSLTVR